MATTVDMAMRQDEAHKGDGAPVVAVENLEKCFGSHQVLDGVSLSVHRGETLAVLGRSGTGKSVLLRVFPSTTDAQTTPPNSAPTTPRLATSCPVKYSPGIGVRAPSPRSSKRSGVAANP